MQTIHRATVSTSCVWLLAAVTSAAVGQPATTSECVSDLEAAEVLLRRNYAGYAIADDAGAGGLDAAMSSARGAADNATGVACDEAIRGFLAEFKDGHLLLGSQFSPPVDMPPPLFLDQREPVARPINDRAFLLRVPSFAVGFKRNVDSLLEKNRAAIQSHETLVVDVRGNTGGGDSTWTNIIDPIYSGPMKRWGIKWRPTDDNAGAIEKQVEELRKSGQGSASVCNGMQQVADEMRTHLDETLAALGPQLPTTVTLPEVWPSPRRVAIIVDGSCGSSCENFLLAARQSEKVTSSVKRPTARSISRMFG